MRHLSTDLRRDSSVGLLDPLVPVGGIPGPPRPLRLRHPHLPPLYYSVRNRDWDAATRRVAIHPRKVWIREDIGGNTPLHVACRLDPPEEIVRALLRGAVAMGVGRDALREIRNAEGATALHVACSHRAGEGVVRALVEPSTREDAANDGGLSSGSTGGMPMVAALTRTGRSPLHYACMSFRGLGIEAFQTLLESTVANYVVNTIDTSEGLGGRDDEAVENLDDSSVASSIDCKIAAAGVDAEEDTLMDTIPAFAVDNPITLRDASGQTPLGLLFRRYRERVRCVIKMVEQNAASAAADAQQNAQTIAAQAVRADLGELWEKARFIVSAMAEQQGEAAEDVAVFNGTFPDDNDSLSEGHRPSEVERTAAEEAAAWAASHHRPSILRRLSPPPAPLLPPGSPIPRRRGAFRIVHASVGLTGYGCPPEMVRLAASVHPDQVREMDEDGNLPLHIAAVASSFASPDMTDLASPGSDEASLASAGGASLALSVVTATTSATATTFGSFGVPDPRPFDAAIRILLRHYPEAARIPHGRTGRPPFVLAMDAGRRTWDDGMRALLSAYPPALYFRDLKRPELYAHVFSLVGNVRTRADEGAAMRRLRPRSRSRSKSKVLGTLFELVRARPNLIKPQRQV
eukprot:CAMPEP_0183302116 /NCGR_PEP_ID=MMETSP0160_2-20130417/8014_1 /TAXON_ID=2839 ORGANISM="Odontella Sinensis, Strain Grunow 1884" /NCGR_SAMPLE_ID=MMETSP0160_2 /ASSEMBLY_ACC=CAM_ASM_000250 /LENGTH=631 /DNA_ID=CAMNT_0025464843 /DNA_START=233 /DNA_END=2128 /DNA_ORIENTATION=+